MLQIIVSIDAPAGLAQAVKEALASYLDLFGRSRVVEVNEILPQQLRLSCSGGHLRHPSGRSRIVIAQKGPPADTGGVRLKPCAAAQGLTLPKKSRRTLFELNQKKRTIDKTPPDVGKWKYYIKGVF